MIVEGKQIPPAAEIEMERWLLEHRYTAGRAMRHAEGLLKVHGADFALAHRMVDRMIQNLRKAGKIAFTREGRDTIWSASA